MVEDLFQMKRVMTAVRKSWCYSMHPAPMWPINGYYICPRCQLRYPVPWEKESAVSTTEEMRVGDVSRQAVEVKQAA
jgi:hypothetical protein